MATTTARPFSALQPSTFGSNICGPSSTQRTFTRTPPPIGPRSYLRPSSAASNLEPHHFATMGFHIVGGDRGVTRSPRTRKRSMGGEIKIEAVSDDHHDPKHSTSMRYFSGGLHRTKKKRSITSLFTAAEDDRPLGTISSPALVTVNDQPVTAPPEETKRVSVVPESEAEIHDEDANSNGFQQRNRFIFKGGMKHHPYPDEAPYMQAYDPVLLDNDRLTEALLRRLNTNGSPTFHDYGLNPPKTVLDLGCGHGRWVVDAATTWKAFGTKVTGFDLVDIPIHYWDSHSWEVDEVSLDNITWVQGNFLKYKLPFADNSFDLVRMANLSLAIPHDGWLAVFAEVRRVLAPEGRLELIDDQMLFPYDGPPAEAPVLAPQPSSRHKKSASSFESDSEDDDMTDTDGSSTLVDEPNRLSQTLSSQAALAEWETHANNSKGLETIFENMLQKKYSIDPRPQDVIDITLARTFGAKHADQIKTMRLALAPGNRADDFTTTPRSATSLGSGKSGRASVKVESQESGPEVETNIEKPERPERPGHALSFENNQISPKAAEFLGIIDDQPNVSSDKHAIAPDYLRAGRIKLRHPKVWRDKWNDKIRGRRSSSMESLRSVATEAISPKAAERLGIAQPKRRSGESEYAMDSQSSDANTSLSRRGTRRNSQGLGVNSSSQSPGLILWPSTFIPVEPLELEMHACKNMHVLLGCKPALSEFIEDIKGPDGKSHISKEEFNELTWEYECFRRKRFNWPEIRLSTSSMGTSSITPDTPNTTPTIARPATSSGRSIAADSSIFKRPKTSPGRPNSVSTNEGSMAVYNRENLTFVRVFRVYEAYKTAQDQ